MEKYFGPAYRGDPGVPHSGLRPFGTIWAGSFIFSAILWVYPYTWNFSTQFNYHDRAFLFEQYHWKKARAKNQPYKFKWNEMMGKEGRDSYYFNWPIYFK